MTRARVSGGVVVGEIKTPEDGAAALLAAVFWRAVLDLNLAGYRGRAEMFLKTPTVLEWAHYLDIDPAALRSAASKH